MCGFRLSAARPLPLRLRVCRPQAPWAFLARVIAPYAGTGNAAHKALQARSTAAAYSASTSTAIKRQFRQSLYRVLGSSHSPQRFNGSSANVLAAASRWPSARTLFALRRVPLRTSGLAKCAAVPAGLRVREVLASIASPSPTVDDAPLAIPAERSTRRPRQLSLSFTCDQTTVPVAGNHASTAARNVLSTASRWRLPPTRALGVLGASDCTIRENRERGPQGATGTFNGSRIRLETLPLPLSTVPRSLCRVLGSPCSHFAASTLRVPAEGDQRGVLCECLPTVERWRTRSLAFRHRRSTPRSSSTFCRA